MLVQLYEARYIQSLQRADRAEALRWLREAQRVVDLLLRADPESVPALRLQAELQHVSGQYLAARKTLDRLTGPAGDDVKVRLLKARVAIRGALARERMGPARFERVLPDLRYVLKLDPANAEATILLADSYAARKRTDEAAALLAELHARNADNAEYALRYAAMLRRAGKPSEAAQVVANEKSASARLLYAESLAETGKLDEAVKKLTEWAASGDEDRRAYQLTMAKLLAKAGRMDEAFAAADQFAGAAAGERALTDATPTLVKMQLLAEAKDYDLLEKFTLEQIEQIKGSGEREKNTVQSLRVNLLRLLVKDKPQQARELYEKLLAAAGEDYAMLMLAQHVYSESRPAEQEKVIESLRRALKVKPDSQDANNNLAYLWADRGVNLDEAERLARAALAIEPRANVQDTLGWVKYKQGDFQAAIRMLLLGLNSNDGDNAVIHDHVGDTYWRLGQKDQAVEMWAEAADLAEADLAAEGDDLDADTRRAGREAPKKIQAVKRGQAPPVAPLGEGVNPPPASR
jgi:predicted Zn-dependent protease